jgi:hypothetical protein
MEPMLTIGTFILAGIVAMVGIAAVAIMWPQRSRSVAPWQGTPKEYLAMLHRQWLAGAISEQKAWEEMWLRHPAWMVEAGWNLKEKRFLRRLDAFKTFMETIAERVLDQTVAADASVRQAEREAEDAYRRRN